jgi:hypothetical protein
VSRSDRKEKGSTLKLYRPSRSLVLSVLGALAQGQVTAADILPAERQTVWAPGIPGGIPVRTAVCATVQASTYGNGSADAAAGIQAALNACPAGQVVMLSAGDFKITATLQIEKGIVLRGQGPTQTRLKMPIGTPANVITLGEQWFPDFTQATNLASDAVKESYSLTLVSNPGVKVGELVSVSQLTDPNISHWSSRSPKGDASRGWFARFDRPVGQIMEVTSVNGNVIGFSTPFHITFETAFDAELTRIGNGNPTKYAGVEDLYVEGGSNGQGNIWFHGAYCWAKNVESAKSDGSSIRFQGSFRCVLRDSYVHSSQYAYTGGGGYGIVFREYASDNLVENNIVWNFNKVMTMQPSGGGNVIGYNYMEDGWNQADPGWMESGLNASHMTTAHYELFEGNQAFCFDADDIWGGSAYITVFRNHMTGFRRSLPPLKLTDAANRVAAQIGVGHWWYSFIGNVLGSQGQDPSPYNSFTYEDIEPWSNNPVPMWRLGRGEGWGPTDPKVVSTTLRDGNYDYVTNSVKWDSTPQAIPNSLYLISKPAFFGNNPWPWVDPTGATKLHTLPARARFDAGTPNPYVYVASISPVSGSTEGGTTVTVHGNGFGPGATLTIGSVAASDIVVSDPTSLTALTGAHATGLADVTVTTPTFEPGTLAEAFFYAPPPTPVDYYTLTPCRLVDTRTSDGPALAPFERRVWTLTGECGVPFTANAVSLNLAVVGASAPGHIRLAPGNGLTDSSAVNFSPGKTRANNAIILLATDDTGTVAATNHSSGSVHLILDVSGYFE